MNEKMTISELIYDLRTMARSEVEAHKKDCLFKACGLLEHIDDFCHLTEIVKEHCYSKTEFDNNTVHECYELDKELAGMLFDILAQIREQYAENRSLGE